MMFALARRFCGVGGLIVMLHGTLGAGVYQAGRWPLEVTMVADQPSVMLGEPAWVSFKVTNLSNEPLKILSGGDYENDFGRPASFAVATSDSFGRPVEQPEVGATRGGITDERDLPAKGSYVFRLFMPHWAIFRAPGTYAITGRRTLQLRPSLDGPPRATTEVVVEERATLLVTPRNDAALKRLIAKLGETMVEANGNKRGDEAVISLAWIQDPAVVPYFRRALQIRMYAFKFIAIQVMGRFSTDEAFDGLRAAMATKPSDFDYAAARSAALAENIRGLAAGALTKSANPRAREYLVTQRYDESEPVRLMVMRVLARLPATRAIPLLEEMADDRSAAVRAAAEEYLAVLQRPARR